MTTYEQQLDAAFAQVDEQELAALALDLTAIPSPTGEERDIGEFIARWLSDQGLVTFTQDVEEGRVNAVGVLAGQGKGASLMLNGHMDTGGPVPHELAAPGVAAQPEEIMEPYEEDGILYGTGMDNMKNGLAAIMGAATACRRAGLELSGDVIVAGVCGEMCVAPIDQYQGRRYRAQGMGTRYLLTHGVVSDYAVVADGSHFGLTWAECGAVFAKVSTSGLPLYTPFTRRSTSPADTDNAIIKMTQVIEAIEEWAAEFEAENVFRFPAGEIRPRVSIGAISGGIPFKVAVTPLACSAYVDIRLPPGMRPIDAMRDFKSAVHGRCSNARVDFYISQQGHVGVGIEPIVAAITDAHHAVAGSALDPIAPGETSMWTDINVYNEIGIPAVKYGIGGLLRQRDGRTEWVPHTTTVDDLVKATRVYIATALKLCA